MKPRLVIVFVLLILAPLALHGLAAIFALLSLAGLAAELADQLVDMVHAGDVGLAEQAAMRMAAAGPDEEHPYGHGRFETAATLALGLMLVLIAGGLIWLRGYVRA